MDSLLAEFRERFEKRHDRCRELKKKGQKLMACFYGLVPKELIHASGMVPIQLVEDRDPRHEDRSGLLPYLCGMSKNLTGQIQGGLFDYLEGVMVATVCDTNRRIFDVWTTAPRTNAPRPAPPARRVAIPSRKRPAARRSPRRLLYAVMAAPIRRDAVSTACRGLKPRARSSQ